MTFAVVGFMNCCESESHSILVVRLLFRLQDNRAVGEAAKHNANMLCPLKIIRPGYRLCKCIYAKHHLMSAWGSEGTKFDEAGHKNTKLKGIKK